MSTSTTKVGGTVYYSLVLKTITTLVWHDITCPYGIQHYKNETIYLSTSQAYPIAVKSNSCRLGQLIIG